MLPSRKLLLPKSKRFQEKVEKTSKRIGAEQLVFLLQFSGRKEKQELAGFSLTNPAGYTAYTSEDEGVLSKRQGSFFAEKSKEAGTNSSLPRGRCRAAAPAAGVEKTEGITPFHKTQCTRPCPKPAGAWCFCPNNRFGCGFSGSFLSSLAILPDGAFSVEKLGKTWYKKSGKLLQNCTKPKREDRP